ncbi:MULTISPECIES: hypothetical protein [Micromonospora]|uniref:LigA protein n=1 Tax=Micromonospora solifontis TaxID=2487138 RepID=A0ABX9W897_9ACTN|nr:MULTISPECIES: hypothetical protein [Micromonospora]NES16086.1 hypothetical protein [Micromonospora sp. PPF5-17B]NES39737.1 hypothetical protein [Micromonospora solifontis]NES57438.1 hypothetical protein [Micromonospora sp. PPF5-6]RNL86670.1 hypothetical protein EFE23_27090 [Micromonospora solifontis]
MLLDHDTENEIIYELCQLLGRAILPVSRSERPGGPGEGFGTAFFYSELLGTTDDGEVVREWLLTADATARTGYGEIGLRPSVTDPADAAAESIELPGFADRWLHLPEIGLAAMPTGGLRGYAEDRGWRWRTQQVTDAVAAGPAAVARIGAAPGSAFVLALGVADDGSRPLEAVIERVVRDGDALRISTELPAGYVGAPVFGVETAADGELALHCLGLVLPAEAGGHPVATFDRIRSALADATAGFR